MKVRDQDPKENKNDNMKSQDMSNANGASGLYDRGQRFVKRKEAKLNELRQQREPSQNNTHNYSKNAKSTPRIFDEMDTNEKVENRLINHGKSRETRLMERRRLKELEEQDKKFSFAPQINKRVESNPESDLL